MQIHRSDTFVSVQRGHGPSLNQPELAHHDLSKAEQILVIGGNLVFLEGLLRQRYRIKLANRGTRGLQMAMADEQPDLILLEANMPNLDGFAVCELLQSHRHTWHIPIMFLADAHDEESDRAASDRGIGLGAIEFIFKPVAGAVLLQIISRYFLKYGWVLLERQRARGY